jgi:hypothetical protein
MGALSQIPDLVAICSGEPFHLPKVARRWSTRIVDQNVRVRTGRKHDLSTLFIRDVGSNRNNFDACLSTNVFSGPLERVLTPRIDDEIHALASERDGDWASKPL